jgi:hypothetical protein
MNIIESSNWIEYFTHLFPSFQDFIYYLYFGAEKLAKFDRRHGYANNIPGLVLYSYLFAGDIGAVMPNLDCGIAKTESEVAKNKKSYVFQTGSWDIAFGPLRNFIRHPGASPFMISSIKERMEKKCTADITRLIWVTIMPYPRCEHYDTLCQSGHGFRNNYAISAANSW